MSTILGFVVGVVVGSLAAYFLQNNKLAKLKESANRYTQANKALASAESELKDTRARLLILEQSENNLREKIEQSYQERLQVQSAELDGLRSLKDQLEQELGRTKGELETLKQSYQEQIEYLQKQAGGPVLETKLEEHQAQIRELQQAYEVRIQAIEQAHQAKIDELEQAYQSRLPSGLGSAVEPYNPFISAEEEAVTEPKAAFTEMDFLETWASPTAQEEEIEDLVPDDSTYLSASNRETLITAPLEEPEEIYPPALAVGDTEAMTSSEMSFIESLIQQEEDMAIISTLEELTSPDEYEDDDDFFQLSPEEEDQGDWESFGAHPISVNELFTIPGQSDDMDLFNSLELELAESSPTPILDLEDAETDLDFFHLLDEDSDAAPVDEADVSLDDLFSEEFLSSAWDSTLSGGQASEKQDKG